MEENDMTNWLEKGGRPHRGSALYPANLTGKIIVVKYGGSAMVDDELKKNVIQ